MMRSIDGRFFGCFGRCFAVAILGLALGILSFCGSPVLGATGDIAIYREATGNDLLDPGGASMTHDWDTTVRRCPRPIAWSAGRASRAKRVTTWCYTARALTIRLLHPMGIVPRSTRDSC